MRGRKRRRCSRVRVLGGHLLTLCAPKGKCEYYAFSSPKAVRCAGRRGGDALARTGRAPSAAPAIACHENAKLTHFETRKTRLDAQSEEAEVLPRVLGGHLPPYRRARKMRSLRIFLPEGRSDAQAEGRRCSHAHWEGTSRLSGPSARQENAKRILGPDERG